MTEKRQFLRIAKKLCATFVAQIGNSAPVASGGGGVVKSSKCKVQSANNAKPDTRERVILSEVESEAQRDERGSRFGKMVKTFFSSLLIVFVTMVAAPAFSALPAGYTELEYIESTGSQYIDTGVAPTQLSFENTEIFVDGQYASATSSQYNYAALWGTQSNSAWFKTDIKSASQIAVQAGGSNRETKVTVSDALARHQIKMDSAQTKCYVDGMEYNLTVQQSAFTLQNNITLFKSNGVNSGQYATARIYKMHIKSNGSLVRNFIPAKNSSNVLGMYDTVSGNFFTNQGSGSFTAGPVVLNPCRNLFDSNGVSIQTGTAIGTDGSLSSNSAVNTCTTYIPVQPSTTYTISGNRLGSDFVYFRLAQYKSDKTFISRSENSTGERNSYTFTTGASTYYIRFHYIATADINTYQLEQGSTATEYVPYCANQIRIATTAYNSARFSPVQTDLNSAVATIREIVTKTINQTAAIASLQADKQTRPEDACPAGKKCLLVETEENGVIVPHWFPIIEAPEE